MQLDFDELQKSGSLFGMGWLRIWTLLLYLGYFYAEWQSKSAFHGILYALNASVLVNWWKIAQQKSGSDEDPGFPHPKIKNNLRLARHASFSVR